MKLEERMNRLEQELSSRPDIDNVAYRSVQFTVEVPAFTILIQGNVR
jgi:hypothetical protein